MPAKWVNATSVSVQGNNWLDEVYGETYGHASDGDTTTTYVWQLMLPQDGVDGSCYLDFVFVGTYGGIKAVVSAEGNGEVQFKLTYFNAADAEVLVYDWDQASGISGTWPIANVNAKKWRIYVKNTSEDTNYVATIFDSQVDDQTVYTATVPDPADDATSIGLTKTLSWVNSLAAVTTTLYIREAGNEWAAATMSGTLASRWSAIGLALDNEYEWRVDTVHAGGTATGTTWSFTTTAVAAVTLNSRMETRKRISERRI